MILGQREVGRSSRKPVLTLVGIISLITTGWSQTPSATPTPLCNNDTWTPTSTSDAPVARSNHTALWTGSEMIVWGGASSSPSPPTLWNTGGKYNPNTDTWMPTSVSNAPAPRNAHSAVWTGTEMIIWGGYDGTDFVRTGGRYNPITDTWTAISTINAPIGRIGHTATWTGSEMIVWGGLGSGLFQNTGGRYNPTTDTWTPTTLTGAPVRRIGHTAVWTGTEMIVWGGGYDLPLPDGVVNTGGRYNPITDTWIPTPTANAPTPRQYHTAVWANNEMIVWGGAYGSTHPVTGGRYNPITRNWTATTTTNAPTAFYSYTTVWTGSEMIVWGMDRYLNNLNTGGRYDPLADAWLTLTNTDAPARREYFTTVWTGTQMIIWGGSCCGSPPNNLFNSGGRYCAPPPTPSPEPTMTPGPCSRELCR